MKGLFYKVYSSDAVFLFRIHIIATVYEWQTFVDYGSNLLGVSIYFELKLISTLWKVYRKLPCYQGKSSHNSAFFFFVHLQLWIFFGGYIEMYSRIYILDCISCNLFWSYWQFANKNSKQDATVYSSRTLGSDFGSNECTRKGAAAEEEVCFLLTLLWKIILTVV